MKKIFTSLILSFSIINFNYAMVNYKQENNSNLLNSIINLNSTNNKQILKSALINFLKVNLVEKENLNSEYSLQDLVNLIESHEDKQIELSSKFAQETGIGTVIIFNLIKNLIKGKEKELIKKTAEKLTEKNIIKLKNIKNINKIKNIKEENNNYVKKFFKPYLKNFLTTKLIKHNIVIKSLSEVLKSKISIQELINIIIREGINIEEVSTQIAKELDCDKVIILELIKSFIENKKENIIKRTLRKLSESTIRRIKCIVIGGAIASTSWAIGHALDHDIMELLEPETKEYALPLALSTTAATLILYNSDKLLSLLRNKFINISACALNKVFNLNSQSDEIIDQVSIKISEIMPEFILKNNKDNIINEIGYNNFIESLTEEQKQLLNENFDEIELDTIFKLYKNSPQELLKFDNFSITLKPEQLKMLANLIPESRES